MVFKEAASKAVLWNEVYLKCNRRSMHSEMVPPEARLLESGMAMALAGSRWRRLQNHNKETFNRKDKHSKELNWANINNKTNINSKDINNKTNFD